MKEIKAKLIGTGKKFAIVVSRFNEFISRRLVDGAVDCLLRHNVNEDDIKIYWVPGSFEIPGLVQRLKRNKVDCIICLGVVIRGDTPHFDYIASEVTKGIAQLNLEPGPPVVYGIITADTTDQAIERAGTKMGNKGWDAALTGLELVNLYSEIEK
jgi:6,7-dimethyl-8-ribityllumazine synthase|uniref:6,7-dimethyl-8-ribityllumazine synthase n=1 Tax=candidate division WOR-3 bacterium TaxID=2052148 RepID=A0A7C4XE79_UNCW3